MELVKQQPTAKAPTEWFTGDVWFDVVHAGREPSRMRANMVRFAPAPTPPGTTTPSARPCTSCRGSH